MYVEPEDSSEGQSYEKQDLMDMDLSSDCHPSLCDYMIAEEIYEISPDESDRQIIDMVVRQSHT